MKKILTIEQLVDFCEQRNFRNFSSKDMGYQLCVQMPATFEKESEDDSLLFVKVKVFHTGTNRNKSNVTVEAAKHAMKGIPYKPILANIIEVDGVKDFSSHDGYFDEDGNWVYEEKQIGCFTSDKPYMEQDENNEDRYYVYAYAAIPREYTDAAEIIERKNGTKVSVELIVNEMSFDVENKELILDDVAVMGCTCLGIDSDGNEIGEGMEGARMDIEDFSIDNNSICNHFDVNAELINKINDLNETLSNLNIDIFKKEVKNEMSFMEQLLEKYGVTLDDIDFEFETMSDEELEQAFMDKFEASEKEEFDGDDPVEPEVTEPTDGDGDDEEDDEEDESDEEDDADEYTGGDEVTPKKYSIEMSDGTVKEFAVSLQDKISALDTLVNETYSETDNDYYYTIVYDKDVVMVSYWTGKAYRQSYKERKGVYSLQGDRISVHAIYVTDDEEAELDRFKSNYSSIEKELSGYRIAEEKARKEALMASGDYSSISSTEEFNEIDIEGFTFDELKDELDGILLNYAKAGKLNFAKKEEEKVEKKTQFKPLPFNEKKAKKKGRYGSLFSKK